jgi:hypothetical protein
MKQDVILGETEIIILHIIYLIFNYISIFFTGITLLTFLLFKNKKHHKLSIHIMISSFGMAFSFIISTNRNLLTNRYICTIQGFLITYFALCLFNFYGLYSMNLYLYMKKNTYHLTIQRISIYFGRVFPLILSLIPLLSNNFENERFRCWMSKGKNHNIFEFFTFYVWIIIYILFSSFFALLIFINIIKVTKLQLIKYKLFYSQIRYLLFLIIYIFVFITLFFFRLVSESFDNNQRIIYFFFQLFTIITYSAQGIYLFY